MALISPVWQRDESITGRARLYKWTGITESDTVGALIMPAKSDKSVQVEGTLGGGTIAIEGSLMPASSLFRSLRDASGTVISIDAASISAGTNLRVIVENVRAIKPRLTGATGASVDIYVLVVGD